MSATYPIDVEGVLELKSVREPTARALFLAAIRELGKEESEFTLERLQPLMRVEEHFRALLLYDQIDFLRQPFAVADAERDFALNVQRICLEAANAFQRYLRHRRDWASPEAPDAMIRVIGLTLNAIHGLIKWGYFLSEPGRSAPWKQLHALYVIADTDGYAQVPFVLHAAQPSFKPTILSLYLRTLILDLLNTGSLTKIQIEIAEGWFSSWCGDYTLDAVYSSRHHLFYVDLASEAGLQPMRKDSHGDSVRYIRIDGLKSQIEEVQQGLHAGRLYAGYGAGSVFPVEEHAALLAIIEKLYHSILAGSENRIEERTHFEDREVDVAVGVERVMRKMREAPSPAPAAAAPQATSTDTIELSPSGLSLLATGQEAGAARLEGAAADPEVERWRLFDLSSKGYGLIVDRGAGEEVLLNGLIALRNHQTGGWIAGTIVRKQANRVRGEMLVGVEVLAYRPIPISLASVKGVAATAAIYLPGLDTNGKLDSILVRAADFSSDQSFGIRAAGAEYRVRLNRIIKKGPDWIKARFEIEAKV